MKYTLELVNNGWVLTRHPNYEGEEIEIFVFEESEIGEFAEHEAVKNLIYHLFDSNMRRKNQGGLEVTLKEKGCAQEEDEED